MQPSPPGCFTKKLSEARGNGIGVVAAGEADSCPKHYVHSQKRKVKRGSSRARRPTAEPSMADGRCLHGLCYGSQWPWLTSPMQAASPEVARAGGPLNNLHPLVSSGGTNNSVCFLRELLLLWALPCISP